MCSMDEEYHILYNSTHNIVESIELSKWQPKFLVSIVSFLLKLSYTKQGSNKIIIGLMGLPSEYGYWGTLREP